MAFKLILLIFFATFLNVALFSQDILVMKNGDEIKVKVLEILPDLVKYKKWDNQEGPSYSEYKTNIFMIKYQNGSKDIFTQQPNTQSQNQTSQISTEDIRKNEAVKLVENYFINGFKNAKKKTFNMVNFKKTNGVMRNIFGQSVYEINFDLTLQFLTDAWMKGNSVEGYWHNDFRAYSTKPDLSASGEQFLYDVKFFPKGSTYIIGGTATMENTDNGYKLNKYEIKTTRDLGIKPIQSIYTDNSSQQQNNPSNQAEIINNPVDYKSYKGFFSVETKNFLIRIASIQVKDELNNISEAQTKILESFSNMKRLKKEISNATIDTLDLDVMANFSYRNYSTSSFLAFFADCQLELRLSNKRSTSPSFSNIYKLSNYNLLSKGFSSPIEANRNLISSDFNQTLAQFIIGNFPLIGEIIEVTEKNKKQDEAKIVKIDIGRSSGIFTGYKFIISDYNSTKADITVNEAFEDYCLCKVNENEKRILIDILSGKHLKVKTLYKP